MCTNDQRFLDQKTMRVAVTPQSPSVSPVDVMARVLLVFGEGGENDVGVFVLRLIRGVLLDLSISLRVGGFVDQFFLLIPNSRGSSQCRCLLVRLHRGCCSTSPWLVVVFAVRRGSFVITSIDVRGSIQGLVRCTVFF